jgi:endoglucanase
MNRRQFLQASAAMAAGVTLAPHAIAQTQPATIPASAPANSLPLWRGFNLLEMFVAGHARDFRESDFVMLANWGFNFVRLPLSYLCWSSHLDWTEMREGPLANLDQAVKFGQAHGIHVNLNLHRLPGYCVNPPKEPASIWTDDAALDAAAGQWAGLARRYKDVPSSALSFDLINEPADLHVDVYVKVITRLVQAIRAESENRLIIADGLKWGRAAVPELVSLNIGQSTRGYSPVQISHYKADWMQGSDKYAVPTWPLTLGKETWDKARLRREQEPWLKLQQQGVGIHVGEWGAYNKTTKPRMMWCWRGWWTTWIFGNPTAGDGPSGIFTVLLACSTAAGRM